MKTPRLPARRRAGLPSALAALALGALSLGGLAGCGAQRFVDNARLAQTTQKDLQASSRAAHLEVVNQKMLYDDPRLTAYVNRVGQRVVKSAQQQGLNPNVIVRFFVLDDSDVNAYSNAGGYVYVTRGLLAILRTEDELAAVLGHEVAHVAGEDSLRSVKDSAKRGMLSALGSVGLSVVGAATFNPVLLGLAGANETAGTVGNVLLDQQYSRDMELEADGNGRTYINGAGYDPTAMPAVLTEIDAASRWDEARATARGIKPAPTWSALDDHPSQVARTEALRTKAIARSPRRGPEADYLASVDGMVWGLSDRVGVHRGATFYSRAHNLALPVPGGWFAHQDSSDATLLFISPKNTSRIAFLNQDLNLKQDADAFAHDFFDGHKMDGKIVREPGLPYPVWRGTVSGNGFMDNSKAQAVAWTAGDRGFVLIGLRDDDSPLTEAQWLKTFDDVAARVRPLKPTETKLAQAIKVRVVSGTVPAAAPAGATGATTTTTTATAGGKTVATTTTVAPATALVAAKPRTWRYAELAQNGPLGPESVDVLRVLNGQYGATTEPGAGQRVKMLQ